MRVLASASTIRASSTTRRSRATILTTKSAPPFSESSKISNSVRASNLAQSPPTGHSNCSERLWLHARAILVALENCSRWPGESNQSNSEFAWRTLPPSLFCPCLTKTRVQYCLCNCRWNLVISYGWKPHDTQQRSRYCRGRSRKFLQPSVRLRYNYYIQLVAIERDWMRVPNLKFWSSR